MAKQLDLFRNNEGLEAKVERITPKLRIPKFTESPTNSTGLLKRFITDFCEWNNLKKPKGLSKMDYKQLYDIYHSYQRRYHFSEDGDVVARRDY